MRTPPRRLHIPTYFRKCDPCHRDEGLKEILSESSDELIRAVRKVHAGGRYVTDSLAEKLAYQLFEGGDDPLHARLSDREYDVMCRVASGKAVSEIARELSLSVKTISTYRAVGAGLVTTGSLEKLGGMREKEPLLEIGMPPDLPPRPVSLDETPT